MFPYCSAFADKMNHGNSDKERCIVGTSVVDEVRKAVDMGYGVLDFFNSGNMRWRALTRTPILEVCLQST